MSPSRKAEPPPPPELTFYLYASPPGAELLLTLDSGTQIIGEPCTWAGRNDAFHVPLPPGTPTQGAMLEVTADGHSPQANRGIVNVPPTGGVVTFVLDDIHLQPAAAPEPAPEPPPVYSGSPEEIIRQVYEQGDHDLSSKEGCGTFTEDCCHALHASDAMWGHIKKTGAQNQFNGHAVDAVMLLAGDGCGIYDIIHDSESTNATPAYNYKGPPDNSLWLDPDDVP